jgi:hypothetical protein
MAIQDRNLTEGTRLVAKYKKEVYICVIAKGDKGRLFYRLEDGRDFKSPSAAGAAITGSACNGWVFWRLDTGIATPAPKPERTEPKAPAVEKKTADTKCDIKRVANQNGSPEGQTRWRCYTCNQSFYVTTGKTPTTHPAS